jgi:DNA-binding NarL/FixJ family response regulator
MDNNHIIIAHGNNQFLEGIVAEVLIRKYEITQQFTSGVRALRYILKEKPQIAVLQSQFEDISAFEIIRETRAKASKMDIAGCIYAGEVLDNLLICLNTVLEGDVFVSKGIKQAKNKDTSLDLLVTLSNTEMKVLTLISIYRKSSKISEKLGVSIRTIEKHRSNIIKKLKINCTVYSLPNWAEKNKELIQALALQNFS